MKRVESRCNGTMGEPQQLPARSLSISFMVGGKTAETSGPLPIREPRSPSGVEYGEFDQAPR